MMDSKEIKKSQLQADGQAYWLAEIALQLAKLNERLDRWDDDNADGGTLSVTRYPL